MEKNAKLMDDLHSFYLNIYNVMISNSVFYEVYKTQVRVQRCTIIDNKCADA